MTPQERRQDAVDAAHEWQEEARAASRLPDLDTERFELKWVDTGNGPGRVVWTPRKVAGAPASRRWTIRRAVRRIAAAYAAVADAMARIGGHRPDRG